MGMDTTPTRTELYIDNTTMIGVAQLVCNPAVHLSAYTLLDLEAFCEAFILFDGVVSLRQQSVWFLKKVLGYESLESMRLLFREMRAAGVFSTRYAIQHRLIDEDVIRDIASRLEGDAIKPSPSAKLSVDRYLQKEGAFAGSGKVDDLRTTYAVSLDDLLYPTLWYFVTSMYEGKPYSASSVRVPIVRQLVKACNHRGTSAILRCLELCEAPWRARIETAARAFEGLDLRLSLPPLLKYVLEQCDEPADIGPAILKTRNRADVVRFREWCRKLQHSVNSGNVDEICRALEEIEQLSAPQTKTLSSILVDVEAVLTIWASPFTSLLDLAKNNVEYLYSWIRNRHLVFIKRLTSSTDCIKHNKELIEKVFGVPLAEEELNRYAELRALEHHHQ